MLNLLKHLEEIDEKLGPDMGGLANLMTSVMDNPDIDEDEPESRFVVGSLKGQVWLAHCVVSSVHMDDLAGDT